MDCTPGTDIGDYRLDCRVGQGGMCSVYAAHHRSGGTAVAIKILDRESTSHAEEMALRFVQEAQLCARMDHANLVPVHDVGKTVWDAPFMVMDLLEGEDLQTFLERQPRLGWMEACHLMQQVLTGLSAIHTYGVVHRDIKPENCFLDRRKGHVELKLLDFGIAQPPMECRACDTAVTIILGTPNYMAPEQARGRAVDGRADLYAAGVMFFRLLSGRLPYPAKFPADVIAKHLRAPIPSLFDAEPDLPVPWQFDRFLCKAMAKQPSRRFGSAEDMLRALDKTVAEAMFAPKPKPWVRAMREPKSFVPMASVRPDLRQTESTRRLPAKTAIRALRPTREPQRFSAGRVLLVAAAAAVAFYGVDRVVEAFGDLEPAVSMSNPGSDAAGRRESGLHDQDEARESLSARGRRAPSAKPVLRGRSRPGA